MDDVLDELFAQPLTGFTKFRDEIVRALNASGKKEEADEVKSIRKPSQVAWALNQVSRRNGKELEWLVEADKKLRDAGAGGAPEAAAARRKLIKRLSDAGLSFIEEAGGSPSESTRERIGRALLAIGIDDEARKALILGRLVREPEAGGVWQDLPPIPPAPAEELDAELESKIAEAKARVARLETESRRARAEAERAEREAQKAARDLKRLTDKREA